MDVLCLVKNIVVQSQHQDLFQEVISSTPLSNCLLEKIIFFFWKVTQAVSGVQSLSCVQLFAIRGLQHTSLLRPSLSPGVCSHLMSTES